MNIRSHIARQAALFAQWALKKAKRKASSLPGKIAYQLDPKILAQLGQAYDSIIITGSNGKTLTTAYTSAILREKYPHVVSNESGANMVQGIITCLLPAADRPRKGKGLAVLEVDEGSLKHVVPSLQPKVILFTNIFNDQVDRFGSVDHVYDLLVQAARMAPETTLIINADQPTLNRVKLSHKRKYFGIQGSESSEASPSATSEDITCPLCGRPLVYSFYSYANLGHYRCLEDDFSRPALDFAASQVDSQGLEGATFQIQGQTFQINHAGLYNIYNALAAYAVGKVYGVSDPEIQAGYHKVKIVGGRQEKRVIAGKTLHLNLVKNTVGLNQVLDLVAHTGQKITLGIMLNARYADGQDSQWIQEGQFEKLASYPVTRLVLGGMAQEVLKQRIEGLDFQEVLSSQGPEDFLKKVMATPDQKIHILANYTAMTEIRSLLKSQD